MFTRAMRTLFCAAGISVLLSGFTLSGQALTQNPERLSYQSLSYFEAGDYRSALTGFRNLMEDEPENALHSYYAGRCLVELNEQLNEAIELLYGASTRGVPLDVNYYLGMAYHRSYNFTDALKYFSRFELEATRQELKEYNLRHLMATCRSAGEITATYNPFEVMNVTFIDLFDSLQYSQVKMKGGHLQRKPDLYFSDDEERDGLTSLMFIPPSAGRGDFLYYAGYSRNKKDGAQLFRVKRGTARAWSDPEEIKVLNTAGDEIMPYFDPIEDDLYFASNGRLGIGGYDLYRSHYDRERDQWSEPINLGFPVNSVMDELLLLPGTDLGMVMFFTTRQGTDSTVTVYRIHLIEPKKQTVLNDYQMLRDIASLGGVAHDILAEMERLEAADEPSMVSGEDNRLSRTEESGTPEITPVTILNDPGAKSPYQETLAEALRHQAVSDSLKDLATQARIRVRESEDPNDRWVWQKQIMLWEKKAHDEEELADALYQQIEEERSVQRTAAVNVPETIEVDTVINDLTVYRFTSSARTQAPPDQSAPVSLPTSRTQAPPDQSAPVSSPPPPDPGPESINRFDILRQSPYGPDNPIPLDVLLPAGTFYRIQMGVFHTEVDADAFGGISPITGERLRDRGLIKYYAGKFTNYADASSALSQIRSDGFEDAFIVAWYNGVQVSTQRAKQLE